MSGVRPRPLTSPRTDRVPRVLDHYSQALDELTALTPAWAGLVSAGWAHGGYDLGATSRQILSNSRRDENP
jgi:hypothetical protein